MLGVADPSLDQRPNVIITHVGTNDMNSAGTAARPWDDAAERMGHFIDVVHERCPDAVHLVAQIMQVRDTAQNARIQAFNADIPATITDRQARGWRVGLVDFSGIGPEQMGEDGIHPTDATYLLMGDIWYAALHALPAWWISPPQGPDPHIYDPYA